MKQLIALLLSIYLVIWHLFNKSIFIMKQLFFSQAQRVFILHYIAASDSCNSTYEQLSSFKSYMSFQSSKICVKLIISVQLWFDPPSHGRRGCIPACLLSRATVFNISCTQQWLLALLPKHLIILRAPHRFQMKNYILNFWINAVSVYCCCCWWVVAFCFVLLCFLICGILFLDYKSDL